MNASNAEGTFCDRCKCHKKLCISPNLHQAVTVKESFAGAGLMEMEFTLVASSVVANSSPWPQQVMNKGCLGQQTLLISQITLKNKDDSVSVKVVWDSRSESSFFHPALLPFPTHPRKIGFILETLSCKAQKPEIVKGIEASFEVELPGGPEDEEHANKSKGTYMPSKLF